MRLRTKIILLSGIIWLAFIALAFTHTLNVSPFLLLAATILITLLIFSFLHWHIFKRIKKINEDMSAILIGNSLVKSIQVEGGDEISLIAAQINLLIASIAQIQQQIGNQTQQYLQDLQNTNAQLKKEITELHVIEKTISTKQDEIAYLSDGDSLTTLPNQTFFSQSLTKSVKHAKRHHKLLALLVLNVDDFKQVNVRFGRKVGDSI